MHSIFGVSTAILVGGGWYLRALVHTGNPVYPFFRHVFGGAGLDEVLDPIKRPMAVSAWNLLTALGPMTLEPDRFDSFSHQFGPVFLLFLPALALERAPRRVLGIAGLGYAFLTLCLTQRQSMRFVLIAVGPLAVAVAWLASTWWERRSTPGRILVAVLVLALGFEASLALARARHGLGVVLGREIGIELPDPARADVPRGAMGRRPPARRGPDRGPGPPRLYFPRDYTMELAHRRRTGLGTRGESADGGRVPLARGRFHPRAALPRRSPRRRSSSTRPWAGCSPPGWRADPPCIAPRSPTPTASCAATRFTSCRPAWRRDSRGRGGDDGPADARTNCGGRVHKDRHREIGNWLARRVARPSAVYGTWVAVRLGASAHQVTLLALLASGGSALAIGDGDAGGVRRRGGAGAPGVLARPRRRPGGALAGDEQPRRGLLRLPDASRREPRPGLRPRLRPGRPDGRRALGGGGVR